MSCVLNTEELGFEILSEENAPKDFDCGVDDLNDFILNDALEHQQNFIAVTNLVYHNEKIVGFFSLMSDCIALDTSEFKESTLCRMRRYSEYPAIKIGRLAVCNEFKKRGVGKTIFKVVLGLVVEKLQPKMGIRFISVDANPDAVEFYRKLGFLENLSERETIHTPTGKPRKTISMRFDTMPVSSPES